MGNAVANISKYEALAAIMELGSLSRAAGALGCTQSAVSHAVYSFHGENTQRVQCYKFSRSGWIVGLGGSASQGAT